MKVGVIGLGNMGGRIAHRLLQQGVPIRVYDTNPNTTTHFQSLGALPIVSPKELAKESDVILTVLPNAQIVKAVVLGPEGILEGIQSGSIVIDVTTSLPKVTKELGEQFLRKGAHLLDAPVSGGTKKAEQGQLTLMVGGEAEILQRVLPILQHIGTNIIHVGALGAGHTIKALNNLLTATTLGITAEALSIGVKMGLDPDKMLQVINTSSGRNHSSEVKFPQQVLSRKFEVGFTVDLMKKDTEIALQLAEEQDIPVVLSAAVVTLWREAVESGFGMEDHTAIARYIEQLAGVEIKGGNGA
jgi:3-hydroxyisobutyrate dehydrogenase-like beta-hydroxyacid dehydrogenase